MLVYRRSFSVKSVLNLNGFVWFSLDPDYGKHTYGDVVSSYILNANVNLFDIGASKNRDNLINLFVERSDMRVTRRHLKRLKYILHPDEQYSCCESNTRAHNFIKSVIGDIFDGTIIDEANADEDLKGATEVVLWNFTKIRQL
jgi:hypothetical protein